MLKATCVQLSSIENPKAILDAVVTLANIVEDSEHVVAEVVEASGVELLLAILAARGLTDARTNATKVLTALCHSKSAGPEVRSQLLRVESGQEPETGSVAIITAGLLHFARAEQALCAATADLIAALCIDGDGGAEAFVAAGAVPFLVHMLATPETSLRSVNLPAHAAHALAEISATRALQSACESALAPLVTQLCYATPSSARDTCVRAILHLTDDHREHKIALMRHGGAHALVGHLISASTPESCEFASRALVQLCFGCPEGTRLVPSLLWGVLLRWPGCSIDFSVPGATATAPLHRALHRERVGDVIGTLATIPLEPLRARLAAELTIIEKGDVEEEARSMRMSTTAARADAADAAVHLTHHYGMDELHSEELTSSKPGGVEEQGGRRMASADARADGLDDAHLINLYGLDALDAEDETFRPPWTRTGSDRLVRVG